MTEIALRDSTTLDYQPSGMSPIIHSLAEWAQSASAAHSIAQSLVQTSFVPEAFRGKAHEATAAILAGAEVGLSPMAALRSFDVIQGVAAPRANTLRAVVQAQGHEVWVVESTDTRAVVEGRRRNSSRTQRSVWTIDRAKKLGLTSKKNWQSQPQAMLVARATAEVCRLVASDAILGLSSYAVEELTDGDLMPATVETVTDETPKKRTARRAPLTPVSEPDFDAPIDLVPTGIARDAAGAQGVDESGEDSRFDPEPSTPTIDPRDVPATRPQVQKLNILLQEAGITDRDDKLAYLSGNVGRGLDSSKDLTKAEANTLIDMLEQEAAAEQATDQGDDSAYEEPML